MQKVEDRPCELIELGSVTADTQGAGGPVLEGFIFMPKTGLSAD